MLQNGAPNEQQQPAQAGPPSALPPRPFLNAHIGHRVAVKLKWGAEYRGHLAAFDDYFNVHLLHAEEWADGACAAPLGEMVIRCNNVLYVRELTDGVAADDAAR